MADEVQAEWLTIRPNTDTACMIALCYELLDKQLYDQQFLHRYTVGFDKFADYLRGVDDGVVSVIACSYAAPHGKLYIGYLLYFMITLWYTVFNLLPR